jgi:Proteolipid membrane potential modulator
MVGQLAGLGSAKLIQACVSSIGPPVYNWRHGHSERRSFDHTSFFSTSFGEQLPMRLDSLSTRVCPSHSIEYLLTVVQAVFIHKEACDSDFWLNLLLTILFWFPGKQ